MDDMREASAAGLLTALVSSALVPGPTSIPSSSPYGFASSAYHQTPFAPGSDPAQSPGVGHGGHNGNSGGKSWSPLIGIITALIGNVLISFALNIQRYAHIRIEREYESEKVRLGLRRGASWRRNAQGGMSSSYGTLSTLEDDHNAEDASRRGTGAVPESERNGREYRYRDRDSIDGDDELESGRHDRLQQSFLSDQTLRPAEKVPSNGYRKSYLRSPYWWAGIVLMTIGEAGNFLAYGFAPASIVSPLGVVALVSNCVIAPIMLKERFRKRDFLGVVVAIAGTVVVILSANSSETKIGPHDIWVMITRWEFELYLGLTAALIVTLMWFSGKYGSRTILIDVGLVGLFGGYTALSTKGVASLLSFTLWHVITFPITYVLVAILVFSALMQIRYINRALQRFDSTQVIPTQFVLFTLSVIIGSAILYRDFESTTASQAGKFVGGCAMTFLGVYMITSGRVRADDESSISIDDEEEAIGLLDGERYRDSIDLPPPEVNRRGQKPAQTALIEQEGPQSPRGSLLSDDFDDNDDELHTPRGGRSPSRFSQAGSLTAESLSPEIPSSPAHPQSLVTNPWAASQERLVDTAASEPQILPSTPPNEPADNLPPPPAMLLRFPSAPGISESAAPNEQTSSSPPPAPSPARDEAARVTASRHGAAPQTPPQSGHQRNRLSVFAPGPLLPPLSNSLSAVVAESLRRGEGSPGKNRTKRKSRKRKHSDAAALAEDRYRDGDVVETEYDTEVSVDDDHRRHSTAIMSTPASTRLGSRLGSTGNVSRADYNDDDDNPGNHQDARNGDDAKLTRLRSLSDSWGGGLAWLNGTFRRSNKRRRGGFLSISHSRNELHDEQRARE